MTIKADSRPLRVLQLTDPHLMADPGGALLGVNTRDSLSAVISEVLDVHGQPDLILATGDLAQDGSEEAYRVFGEQLQVFGCQSAWISGNHDRSDILHRVATRFQADQRQIVQGGWQFVLLDSSVSGKVFGELAPSELDFLERCLSQHPGTPTIVSLHHHPVDIGSDWMEKIGLQNREAFWHVIDQHPQVKIVLWGHIHQDLEQQRRGVSLLATPSTCIQFTAGSSDFSVEPLPPGYRWFELGPGGEIHTEVRRAHRFEFTLDQNSSGY
ncbi:3',5'-cyclic-AMP phosphodiesterase [Marinobacter salinexigens]|uniref:3',5'-cyclic-AMP phosphodiesterase n=1 Tax=Marinobacter salinexigens TaxID=2919747 RepID=A0A5B0VB64_9GAMM|nr:3',5'-cyclic-AMP phosphodiesterase [Marinobacter salinexigens]KAA1171638.1 3',5'-cyclic-AMP phosphodiesterase [Marinobacter salinexigens]